MPSMASSVFRTAFVRREALGATESMVFISPVQWSVNKSAGSYGGKVNPCMARENP